MTTTLQTLISARLLGGVIVALLASCRVFSAEPSPSGPQAESRFPPLVLPAGFKATLFACDPFVEYPSVIAAGPRSGALFVAVDYMTGLGTDIVRRDEIRLLEDLDSDGYADRSTVVAGDFDSIEGLAFYDGTLYVMHAPRLTAVRLDSADKVVERRDLLVGLGLPPEENPVRLHCANGVVAGYDGWLYLALGDHGCDVKRPEGDRLVLNGGGILRCRYDGADLHVFATGLRNVYDIALDDRLNVLVRDNENDGGTYKLRVYHSFFGADHGYPYLYDSHPGEALAPLGDFGLGSSAGGASYLAEQFPPEYCGNLFWCEWGRGIVRYRLEAAGSSFAPVEQLDFAVGAENDLYPFKPTDLAIARDGAMFVADWADGQRPNRGRGRIYRITYIERSMPADEPPSNLDEARRSVWAVARTESSGAIEKLFRIAETDGDVDVRVQAIRALGDLLDPTLTTHRLHARADDPKNAERLARIADGGDAQLLREIVVVLGRLQWKGLADWMPGQIENPDFAVEHAAIIALRKCGNWRPVTAWLDRPAGDPLRRIAVAALAEQYDSEAVSQLIARLLDGRNDAIRLDCAGLLARVYKRPGPWVYWGFRPGPRPSNSVAWEATAAIESGLRRAAGDSDRTVRLAVLTAMDDARIAIHPDELSWIVEENEPTTMAMMLEALVDPATHEMRDFLFSIVLDPHFTMENRLRALTTISEVIQTKSDEAARLAAIVRQLEDGPIAAAAILAAAKLGEPVEAEAIRRLASSDAELSAAALDVLADRDVPEAKAATLRLLGHVDARVRRSAARATGNLRLEESAGRLVELCRDDDVEVRRAALQALGVLRDPRAVALAEDSVNDRDMTIAALTVLGDLGGIEQIAVVIKTADRNPSIETVAATVATLESWLKRPGSSNDDRRRIELGLAGIAGAVGMPLRWQVTGPHSSQAADEIAGRIKWKEGVEPSHAWRTQTASGAESRLKLVTPRSASEDTTWLAVAQVAVEADSEVDFYASASGTFQVRINGREVYCRERTGSYRLDSDRFAGKFSAGLNTLLVRVETSPPGDGEFHLRFRRKSDKVEHERLLQEALARSGDPERGRKLFVDAEKTQCAKCHRIDDVGERIGPELSNVGGRFSRIYVVESILNPNLTIAPSFETRTIELADGRTINGVRFAETATTVSLADNQGKRHVLSKDEIESNTPQRTSTMPEGLEKRLTLQEFVDLTTYLMSRKNSATATNR